MILIACLFIVSVGFGQTLIISKQDYDSLVNQRQRYRTQLVRVKADFKAYKVETEDKIADLTQDLSYANQKNAKLRDENIKQEEDFEAKILNMEKDMDRLYDSDKKQRQIITKTNYERRNINILKVSTAMMAVLAGTLLIARSHS